MLVHVGIREFTHKWIWAIRGLGSNARGELGVAVAKLVDGDADNVCVVVELDEALEPLTWKERKTFYYAMFMKVGDGMVGYP